MKRNFKKFFLPMSLLFLPLFILSSWFCFSAFQPETPAVVHAAVNPADFAGGSGTESDPYKISTPQQLQNLNKYLGNDYRDVNYKIINDINLTTYLSSGNPGYNAGAGWLPIGSPSSFPFTSRLDGSNYKITGLWINRPTTDYVGLFGSINYTFIQKLGVTISSSVKGYGYVGGFVGQNSGSIIINCYSTGNVTGAGSYVGGFVGEAGYKSTTRNCYSTGNVTGYGFAGGFAGDIYYATVSSCYSSGTVASSEYHPIGGFVGGSSYSTISNCYSTGSATGFNSVGGFVGNAENGGTISNCYSTGNVNASDNAIGGFAGTSRGVTISNCYSTGTVTSPGLYVGGFVGDGGSINCYYNQSTRSDDYATGVNITTFRNSAAPVYSTWNFTNIWNPPASAYPLLNLNYVFSFQAINPADFAGGNGTHSNPYEISTPQQLQNLNKYLEYYYADVYYEIVNDIDLTTFLSTGNPGYNAGAGWQPIGISDSLYFSGNLNGNNFKIIGLWMNRPTTDYAGLFGNTRYVSIRNLGVSISDSGVKGKEYVGGFVGSALGLIISNCYSTGSVTGSGSYTGGFIGNISSAAISNCYSTGKVTGLGYSSGGFVGNGYDATISNCYSIGDVTGSNYTGGFVGYATGTFSNCYATGNVTGTVTGSGGYTGGFVGYANGSTISNCYATGTVTGSGAYTGGFVGCLLGTISNCYSTGTVIGDNYTGGFVGFVPSLPSSKISNCYSTGNVIGNAIIGGFVGRIANYITISNCYSTGNVTHSGTITDSTYIGGFVGYVQGGSISNCFSTGTVPSSGLYVACFVGGNASGTITNCYYNQSTKSDSYATGVDISTFRSVTAPVYSTWDFDDVWFFAGRYPLLRGFDYSNNSVSPVGYFRILIDILPGVQLTYYTNTGTGNDAKDLYLDSACTQMETRTFQQIMQVYSRPGYQALQLLSSSTIPITWATGYGPPEVPLVLFSDTNAVMKISYPLDSSYNITYTYRMNGEVVGTSNPVSGPMSVWLEEDGYTMVAKLGWSAYHATVQFGKTYSDATGAKPTVGIDFDDSDVTVPNGQSVPYFENIPSADGFSRVGFNHVGWKLSYWNGSGWTPFGTVWSSGTKTLAELTNNLIFTQNVNILLSAEWEEKTYTVYLDPNGGTGSAGEITSTNHTTQISQPYNTLMKTPITVPTREGYTFGGYFAGRDTSTAKNNAVSGTQYYYADGTPSAYWTRDEDGVTLYAKWTPDRYTIKFENGYDGTIISVYGNGGLFDAQLPDFPSEYLYLLVRDGYTFAGFYLGDTQYYNADGTAAQGLYYEWASEQTFTARWIPKNYEVNFNPNPGGTASGTYGAILSNGTLQIPSQPMGGIMALATITPPTRAGYVFGGYYSVLNSTDQRNNSVSGTQFYNASGNRTAETWQIADNGTLYAMWTPRTYTATFSSGLESEVSFNIPNLSFDTALPSIPSAQLHQRRGHVLQGYFIGGTKYFHANGTPVSDKYWEWTENTTFTAQWEEAERFTITWLNWDGAPILALDERYTLRYAGEPIVDEAKNLLAPLASTRPADIYISSYVAGSTAWYPDTANYSSVAENLTFRALFRPSENSLRNYIITWQGLTGDGQTTTQTSSGIRAGSAGINFYFPSFAETMAVNTTLADILAYQPIGNQVPAQVLLYYYYAKQLGWSAAYSPVNAVPSQLMMSDFSANHKNYTFLGFSMNPNPLPGELFSLGSFPVVNQNMNVYLIYSEVTKEYPVIFYFRSGTGWDYSMISVQYGAAFIPPGSLPAAWFGDESYNFFQWMWAEEMQADNSFGTLKSLDFLSEPFVLTEEAFAKLRGSGNLFTVGPDGLYLPNGQHVVIYTPLYAAAFRGYDIEFENDDGTLLYSLSGVPANSSVSYGGDTPVKSATPAYTYRHIGWEFLGTTYLLADFLSEGFTVKTMVTAAGNQYSGAEIRLKAVYEAVDVHYILEWINGTQLLQKDENKLYQSVNHEYHNAVPAKDSTIEFDYRFIGWSLTENVSPALSLSELEGYLVDLQTFQLITNTQFFAVFQQTDRLYTLEFRADLGTGSTQLAVLNNLKAYDVITYIHPDGITDGEFRVNGITVQTIFNFGRTSTAQYSFAFKGWYSSDTTLTSEAIFEPIPAVSGNAVYHAVFAKTVRVYTIRWFDGDGIEMAEFRENAEWGTVPDSSQVTRVPTKTVPSYLVGQVYYELIGWNTNPLSSSPITLTAITGNTSIYAIFTECLVPYTVTWISEDGSIVRTTTVLYGNLPDETDMVDYDDLIASQIFSDRIVNVGWYRDRIGWQMLDAGGLPVGNIGLTEVTGNATYQVVYGNPVAREYEVKWYIAGTLVSTIYVPYNTEAVFTGSTDREDNRNPKQVVYFFEHWSFEADGSPVSLTILDDTVFHAVYSATPYRYLITFENFDGTVLWQGYFDYSAEDSPAYGGAAFGREDLINTYQFSSWTKKGVLPATGLFPVTEDMTYVAVYTSEFIYYRVIFYDETGGNAVWETEVTWGDIPAVPSEPPAKESTYQYTYTFFGWAAFAGTDFNDAAGVTAMNNVNGMSYYARFAPSPVFYSVSVYNYDGTPLVVNATYIFDTPLTDSFILSVLTFHGLNPAAVLMKTGNAEFSYVFEGDWEGLTNNLILTENVSFTAIYTAVKNKYAVAWMSEDGINSIYTQQLEYGTTPFYNVETYGVPQKTSANGTIIYEFTGWDKPLDAITGNISFFCQFSSTYVIFRFEWRDDQNNPIRADQGTTLDVFSFAETPSKEGGGGNYYYRFMGWTNAAVRLVDGVWTIGGLVADGSANAIFQLWLIPKVEILQNEYETYHLLTADIISETADRPLLRVVWEWRYENESNFSVAGNALEITVIKETRAKIYRAVLLMNTAVLSVDTLSIAAKTTGPGTGGDDPLIPPGDEDKDFPMWIVYAGGGVGAIAFIGILSIPIIGFIRRKRERTDSMGKADSSDFRW